PGQQRQVTQRVKRPIALGFLGAVERPVRMPFAWHHVLDRQSAACDPLFTETGFTVAPATPVVLDCLEHHPKAAAPEPSIREERSELLPDFCVVGPVAAATRLASKPRLDHISSIAAVGLAQ